VDTRRASDKLNVMFLVEEKDILILAATGDNNPLMIQNVYIFFYKCFFGVPHLATCISLIFYNEPELGAEINPGMALTPLLYSIGWGSNPRPSDREPSALPLDHSFCLKMCTYVAQGMGSLLYFYCQFFCYTNYKWC